MRKGNSTTVIYERNLEPPDEPEEEEEDEKEDEHERWRGGDRDDD